ncbi:MAG: hypothetical protein CL912_27640 [Deltaproteobacteria bacterium]|nr:hypothetical protein [Deltaproteobacteria bacterium]
MGKFIGYCETEPEDFLPPQDHGIGCAGPGKADLVSFPLLLTSSYSINSYLNSMLQSANSEHIVIDLAWEPATASPCNSRSNDTPGLSPCDACVSFGFCSSCCDTSALHSLA